jgi:hypothetical protein
VNLADAIEWRSERSGSEKKKGQKSDEGVPRTSDRRSRRELHESASPIALPSIRTFLRCNPDTKMGEEVIRSWLLRCNYQIKKHLKLRQDLHPDRFVRLASDETLSVQIVSLTVRILEKSLLRECKSAPAVIRSCALHPETLIAATTVGDCGTLKRFHDSVA